MYPQDLLKVFHDGARCLAADPWETSMIHTRYLGDVVLTSGRLVFICPYMEPDWPPFTTRFPVGRFPVFESVQYRRPHLGIWPRDLDSETVAYEPFQSLGALVRFQDVPPIHWHLARLPTGTVPPEEALDPELELFRGYLNTAGYSMCVMDADAGALLTQRVQHDDAYYMELHDLIEDDEQFIIELEAATGLNLIAFQGAQGVSPAFVGEAADGSVACLVIDLGLQARDLLSETTWQPAS